MCARRRSVEHQLEEERQKLEALVIVAHRVKAQPKYKVSPYGLTEVYSPLVQASVDLVFVHGMFGHPKETWTCDDVDVFWPAELLPPILEDEGTRILTYGYEAGASTFADGESRHKVSEVVESLGRDLASNRQVRDLRLNFAFRSDVFQDTQGYRATACFCGTFSGWHRSERSTCDLAMYCMCIYGLPALGSCV